MSNFQPDLVIKNVEGKPIAVIEVQGRQDLTLDVAMEIRRNMLDSGLPAHIPYFLLLSQDHGFLWQDSQTGTSDVPPAYDFPMDKIISRYSNRNPEQRLFATELELLVLHWLTNLSSKPQKVMEEPEKTLAFSGFNASI